MVTYPHKPYCGTMEMATIEMSKCMSERECVLANIGELIPAEKTGGMAIEMLCDTGKPIKK